MTPIDRTKVFGASEPFSERIGIGFFPQHVEREHLARYYWASRWVTGRIVLDVSCGTGYGSEVLLRASAKYVVSVDCSVPALEFAAERHQGPKYVRADALDLPLQNAAFDVVVSLETIEHLHDPQRFLLGVRRVLREGGILALSMPNRARTDGSNPYHLHEMELPEVCQYLDGSGLQVVSVTGQFWKPRQEARLWRVKGFGRLAYEAEKRTWVWRAPAIFGFQPLYWCILARVKA